MKELPKISYQNPGDLYLVAAQPSHEAYWLEVRNDPDAVRWSRVTKPIEPNSHASWYAQALKMPLKRRLFLVTFKPTGGREMTIGIARLDHRGTWTELSLVLEPFARGKGLGVRVIQILCGRAESIGWPVVGAVVNGRNRRSLRTFIKAGFGVRAKRWIELRRIKTKRRDA